MKTKCRTLGIEREWFIMRNKITGTSYWNAKLRHEAAPIIGELLPALQDECRACRLPENTFSFELYAGQVEDRTPVANSVEELMCLLDRNKKILERVGKRLNVWFACNDYEEAEILGELEVNPFDERHQGIWGKITEEQRLAASQVAAIHVHIGASPEEAVKILNYCRQPIIDALCALGDFSKGKRLAAYKRMAGCEGAPPLFADTAHLLLNIEEKGGEKNVWDMVRYKPSTGTVEFRMFGATEESQRIQKIVTACLSTIHGALA